jgi:hypothetical protein
MSKWSNQDGLNVLPPEGANACMQIDSPTDAKVFYGPFRVLMTEPINLDARTTCARQ